MSRILLTAVLFLSITQSASACNRCGLFGRRCIFSQQQVNYVQRVVPVVQKSYVAPYVAPYVQPAPVYVAPVYTPPQALVVNNIYPPNNGQAIVQSYSTQGNSVYGYNAAAQIYAVNPNDLIRQSVELSKAAGQTYQLALNGSNDIIKAQITTTSVSAEPLIRSQAAVQLLQALNAPTPQASRQTVTLELQSNGKWVAVQAPEQQPSPSDHQAETVPPAPSASIVHVKCAKCHGVDLVTPKGEINFDSGHKIDGVTFRKAIDRLTTLDPEKRMPPNNGLTDQERRDLIRELVNLKPEGE